MITSEKLSLVAAAVLMAGAVIASLVVAIFPNLFTAITATVLVVPSLVVGLRYAFGTPKPPPPPSDPVIPVWPEGFSWGKESLMVVGAGNAGDNLLWRSIRVDNNNKENPEYGHSTRSSQANADQRATWPDFNDVNINSLLYSSLTGFVLYPLARGGGNNRDYQGWRYPPAQIEETNGVTLDPGGRIYFEPHGAALGEAPEAFRFMQERHQEISGIISRQDTFQEINGLIHLVAAGNTGMSFFTQIDIENSIQLDPMYKFNHLILYLEGGGLTAAKVAPLSKAFGKRVAELQELVSVGEGRFLPIILTDNRDRGMTKMDHMALILMLAGSCASNNPVFGDPFRLTTVASLYAPFVPHRRDVQALYRNARAMKSWAQDLVKLNPRSWDCLWSAFDPNIPITMRDEVVILLAGDQDVCTDVFQEVEEEFNKQNVRATAICCYIPGAKSVWMAAFAPLTEPEVEDSVMAEVFKPLAKGRTVPAAVLPTESDDSDASL
jgi:hypothetical protein